METLAALDFWNIHLPAPVALALVAALGYWVGRRNRGTAQELAARSRRDLRRAQMVARELEKITGINNRRGLDDSLTAQLALMNRYEVGFSVAIFDIDHFKHINDEQGHLQGDRILQKVANLLDELARETDLVARYGGEEFLVIMPRTDLDGACLFAERVRAAAEVELPVTVSGGVTTAMDGDTPESLLARADAALYRAKTAGRNCAFLHDGAQIEPVVEGGAPTVHAIEPGLLGL